MERRPAQVAVDQQNVVNAVARQAHGQIGDDKALAFFWHATGDEDRLQRGFIAGLIDARA